MPDPCPCNPVQEYRLQQLEKRVEQDHEPRLRKLESMAAKVAVFAALGSVFGTAAITAIIDVFFK